MWEGSEKLLSDNFSNPKTYRVWLQLDNTELIVDRSRLRRARERIRLAYENEMKVEPFQAFYFDDRKDNTKVRSPNGSFKMIKEEHISLLQEPGSKYIVYLTPESGTARVVTDAFINFFQGNGIKTEDLSRQASIEQSLSYFRRNSIVLFIGSFVYCTAKNFPCDI